VNTRVPTDFTCDDCGKQGWFSKKSARAVLRAMRARYGNAGALRVYPACPGTGFHIGHSARIRSGPNLNDPRLRFAPGA
jgi:hypothetical protein